MSLAESDLRRIGTHIFNFGVPGDRFTGTDALLIWQYVRFNPAYRKAYSNLKIEVEKGSADEDFIVQNFCEEWCMSEPLHFDDPKPPKRFYFDRRLVKKFSNPKVLRAWADWGSDRSPLLLIVNPNGDRNLILQQIEILLNEEPDEHSKKIKASSTGHLTDNFICFYLSQIEQLAPKDVKTRYRSIYPNTVTLQNHQVKRKVKKFRSDSVVAPWCFFAAPK